MPYYDEDGEHYHTTPVSKNSSDVAMSSSESFESPPDVSPIKSSYTSQAYMSESSESEEYESSIW